MDAYIHKLTLKKSVVAVAVVILVIAGILYTVKAFERSKFRPFSAEEKYRILEQLSTDPSFATTSSADKMRQLEEFEQSNEAQGMSAEKKLEILNKINR